MVHRPTAGAVSRRPAPDRRRAPATGPAPVIVRHRVGRSCCSLVPRRPVVRRVRRYPSNGERRRGTLRGRTRKPPSRRRVRQRRSPRRRRALMGMRDVIEGRRRTRRPSSSSRPEPTDIDNRVSMSTWANGGASPATDHRAHRGAAAASAAGDLDPPSFRCCVHTVCYSSRRSRAACGAGARTDCPSAARRRDAAIFTVGSR